MPPAKFNPYDPPRAELPAQPKAAKRAVTFGELVIVAWIFTVLVLIMVPAMRASWTPRHKIEQIVREKRENVLMFLALTIAHVLTVGYVGLRIVKWSSRQISSHRNGDENL